MSALISNDDLTLQLESLLPRCSDLTIISAFITQPATCWLSRLTINNKPRVQLVGRFTPNDFSQGASDINALRDCLSNGYQVRALSNLHAKIYQIDHDIIFNGSANLTGKGLSLVSNGNLESCSRVAACDTSKEFIFKIVESSVILSNVILDKMVRFLEDFESKKQEELPVIWPEYIMPQSSEIFVSDFPLTEPGVFSAEYESNPSLPFARIENVRDNFELASSLFKQTKAYKWLNIQLINNESKRDLGFGQISRLLHEVLADDPSPYRTEIKYLQADFYTYIKLYASDVIEVYIPGQKSECLRFIRSKNE